VKVEHSIKIDAPAATVWEVFTDVVNWPTWTPSVVRIAPLDGPGIEVGKRFEIKQPRLPTLVWEVTDVDPGRSWTWRQRSRGAVTYASHTVVSDGTRRIVVQCVEHRGPFGIVIGALTSRQTRRYLDLEARGLKARSEQGAATNAPPA
jgi:uncharacterized membrane protein